MITKSEEIDGVIQSYQVRFIARASEIRDFIADPDEGIISIFWVDIDDL